jgi:hypothetical protein
MVSKEERSGRRRRGVAGWLWQLLLFDFSPLFATNSTGASNANHVSRDEYVTARPGHPVLSLRLRLRSVFPMPCHPTLTCDRSRFI